jgi:hypothetical protein
VPRDRTCFKLRSNVEKQVCLSVSQPGYEGQKKLEVKRCFGVLLAAGRQVSQCISHQVKFIIPDAANV